MYGSETIVSKEIEVKSKSGTDDNLRTMIKVRRTDRMGNKKIKELVGICKGVDEVEGIMKRVDENRRVDRVFGVEPTGVRKVG